jgi:hypothetical protein
VFVPFDGSMHFLSLFFLQLNVEEIANLCENVGAVRGLSKGLPVEADILEQRDIADELTLALHLHEEMSLV